jgi:hypothetical protein
MQKCTKKSQNKTKMQNMQIKFQLSNFIFDFNFVLIIIY